MINRYGYILAACATVLLLWATACKKTSASVANVLLYNASTSAPGINVNWNGPQGFVGSLGPGEVSKSFTSPYYTVPGGTNLTTFRNNNDTITNKNVYTPTNSFSSFFFFDTAAGKGLSILQSIDDLTQPDTATIKYRIINLSPDTSATADVWLANGTMDTAELATSVTFVGKTASASGLPAFSAIKYHGEAFTLQLQQPGSTVVIASITPSFSVRGIYTIVISGLRTGTGTSSLKINVIQNR